MVEEEEADSSLDLKTPLPLRASPLAILSPPPDYQTSSIVDSRMTGWKDTRPSAQNPQTRFKSPPNPAILARLHDAHCHPCDDDDFSADTLQALNTGRFVSHFPFSLLHNLIQHLSHFPSLLLVRYE